ncbi:MULTISPECIES: M56 family metallopeptidase [unclassified Mucilaginibacter]|uniref:M56 family metallopeptidase n=1 Tax=unclassified Mucilaginibacter TaxID=2617802 RepID=UPI002AC9D13C|nr:MULTISPECIES: M56 family metallopeptidase [unclassified Mucilaginibacter]MEB0261500.1 M56 family metallopeptidase [Mucilaginibacter sp. 10I4]MEB0277863.1 M56 family metallopeptidase [Mucilaginibacter sp. 10B2]MEB0300590.1 M56 family metallopeptidase [Mucilaginibacter sp. 5C4]WPX22755.1 M56 family metallopeptidase [Mucilaginibacter sp. 5C4]
MSWLHYLIEANIYLSVFYLCYCLFLNGDTHYLLGRVYLIFSCIIAFVLPVTQLSILKPVIPEIRIEEPLPSINFNPVRVQQIKFAEPVKHFTFDDAMVYIYVAGVVIALFVLIFRLRKLYILTRKNHSLYQDQYKLVKLTDENTAFSFFNYLFIGSNVPQAETIIAHELVHIRQKHSADIIFLEVVKVFNWFNPFIYLIQRSLKTIHEYIADEQTAAYEQDALAYSSFLLNNAYGIQGSTIAHSFFNYNLLKKRIIMLNKNRSGKLARLKYLAALPLCAGMLCASTLVFSKDYGFIDLAPRKTAVPAIKPDTTFAVRPPAIFGKNFVLQENGYLINKKTEYATVTITDKAGNKKTYNSTNATAADRKMLMEKYNYKFFNYNMKAFIKEASVTDKAFSTNPKLLPPPPPPAPPVQKLMPPPPPPIAPLKTSFRDFGDYLNMNVKYPKAAFDKKSQGSISLTFSVNKNGHISNVKLSGNQRMGFDDALLNSVNGYKGQIKDKAGDYTMIVNFIIIGAKPVTFPSPAKPGNYVGEIHVLGMTAEQRKRLTPPPPPPAPPKPARSANVKPVEPIEIVPPAVKKNDAAQVWGTAKAPLIFVNGERFKLSEPVPTGKKVYITASDSSVVHTKGDAYALNKWEPKQKTAL